MTYKKWFQTVISQAASLGEIPKLKNLEEGLIHIGAWDGKRWFYTFDEVDVSRFKFKIVIDNLPFFIENERKIQALYDNRKECKIWHINGERISTPEKRKKSMTSFIECAEKATTYPRISDQD